MRTALRMPSSSTIQTGAAKASMDLEGHLALALWDLPRPRVSGGSALLDLSLVLQLRPHLKTTALTIPFPVQYGQMSAWEAADGTCSGTMQARAVLERSDPPPPPPTHASPKPPPSGRVGNHLWSAANRWFMAIVLFIPHGLRLKVYMSSLV